MDSPIYILQPYKVSPWLKSCPSSLINKTLFYFLQTNVEIIKEGDYTRLLQIEEEYIEKMCKSIIEQGKPDVVITEKGISDLAQHHLMKVMFSFYIIVLVVFCFVL